MIKQLHNEILNEYEKKQRTAFDNLMARKSEVLTKIPRIQEIESQIQITGIKYNKMILQGLSPVDKAVSSLLEDIDTLKNEKVKLLIESGFTPNYLELIYECPCCSDTGFVHSTAGTQKCSCYRQQLISKLFNKSNLKLAQNENFSYFDETLYPETVNENRYGIKFSPRENIRKVKENCLAFIKNFQSSEEKNLFFSGPAGVGKTFISNCIAMELINKGFTVLYQTAPILFNIINEYKIKSFRDGEFEDMSYSSIFDVDLLIIDDLGTESPSAARYTELLNILNTRHINNLSRPCKTIISSNLGVKNLYDYYTERVASRIVGNFNMYRLAGEDIRTIKRFRGT